MTEEERKEMEERIGEEAYEEHVKQMEFDKTAEGLTIINERLIKEQRLMANEISSLEDINLKLMKESVELNGEIRGLKLKCWELLEEIEYQSDLDKGEEIILRHKLIEDIRKIKENARI